ncbi:MAG: hypothetical protein OXG81_07295, partial [Acidobacteria bacterium]|nr:hypothetical protein [Acidobacteriota bacterium]
IAVKLVRWPTLKIASMFVFSMPLNKFAPALPGCSRASDFSMVSTSFMNAAGFIGFGNKIDQKTADGHSGTTRVPLALQLLACHITRGIKVYWGTQPVVVIMPVTSKSIHCFCTWVPKLEVKSK